MDVQKSIRGHPKKSLDICKTLKLVRSHIWPLKDKKGLTTVANIALDRNCKAHKMTSCKIGLFAIADKCNRPQIFVTKKSA